MFDVYAGKDSTLSVNISTDEDFVSLNSARDKVVYSILDASGNVISDDYSNVSFSINPDSTSVLNIPLPASINVIDEGKPYAIKYLEISYTKGDLITNKRIPYRIINFVPYTASNDDVRTIFGLSDSILTDDMIDIYASYIKAKSIVGESFDSKLNDFGETAIKANRMIVLLSALTLESTLPLLVAKIETDSIVSQTRFTMTLDDFKKLLDNLREELDDLEEELLEGSEFEPTFSFVIGSLNDVFTGEE